MRPLLIEYCAGMVHISGWPLVSEDDGHLGAY